MMTLEKWIETPIELTEEEYNNWLKTADKIGQEHCCFSSFCGTHDFSMEIEKDGILYELHNGWYPENNKTIYTYGIKQLHMLDGQNGDRI